jgi:DNA-binding transcriptional regulator YiaG
VYFNGPALGEFDLAVANKLARAGVSDGEAIKFMRKAVGLPAVTLAELLDTSPETVSRWERGVSHIDRAAFAILAGIVMEKADHRQSRRVSERHRVTVTPRIGRAACVDFGEDSPVADLPYMHPYASGLRGYRPGNLDEALLQLPVQALHLPRVAHESLRDPLPQEEIELLPKQPLFHIDRFLADLKVQPFRQHRNPLFIAETGAIAAAQDLATRAGRAVVQIAEPYKVTGEFLFDLPTPATRCR